MNLRDSSDNSDFFLSAKWTNLGEAIRGGYAFLVAKV